MTNWKAQRVKPPSIPEILVRERARMTEILADGLPDSYPDWEAFLGDYHPDFSWDRRAVDEFAALLQDPEWLSLADQIKAKHGYDFKSEAKQARREARS